MILLVSAILLIVILVRSHFGERVLHATAALCAGGEPAAAGAGGAQRLCDSGTRSSLVLMLVTYGYPIGQFFFLKSHSVPAVQVTSQEAAPAGVP